MAFIFHKMAWLCLSILATGGAHYPVRMFSPLSYYLLIIALFSIDNAFRNFHVIFSPLVPLLTCTAMGEDLGINPRKSRIMNLVDSWRSFQGILWEGAEMLWATYKAKAWELKNLHWSLGGKEGKTIISRLLEKADEGFRFSHMPVSQDHPSYLFIWKKSFHPSNKNSLRYVNPVSII